MYPKNKFSLLTEKSAADLATELLPLSGANTLDVGCGTGEFSCFLSRHGANVSGIDPNPERISAASAQARSMGLRVNFYEGFAENLPFANDEFDIVIFSNSLHHVDIEMIPKALAEAERVLSKLGFLYIMEPVPSGGYFNTAQPVVDETHIRSVAYDNIQGLDRNFFTSVQEVFVSTPKMHYDFSDFLSTQTARNPQRAKLYERHRREVELRFRRNAKKVPEGFVLDAAIRINLFRKNENRGCPVEV
ncbi:MAG: class I SAM-dependent methyltransferase [Pseudomonadota bacterium]|nr:class I SAM-dependent methyltransferase [Pseudomonadota bacterium]